MGAKDGITVVFNRPVFSADGEIELTNMESGSSEQFDVKDSERVEINGTKLTVRPEKALISDKDYKLRIPAHALKDSEGNSYGGIDNYQFKTQVDIAFLLAGYGDTTLYETTESFEANAQKFISFLYSLSAGEISSYKTYSLSNIGISDSYAKSLGHLEAVEAAGN